MGCIVFRREGGRERERERERERGWKQIWSWFRGIKILSLMCLFVPHRDNTFKI
jgi:hypothetical protein